MIKLLKLIGAGVLLFAVSIGSYATTGIVGSPIIQAVSQSGTWNVVTTNAGTFAVQAAATLAAETTKIIGTINVAAGQTIAVTNAGTFAVQTTAAVSVPAHTKVGATTTSASLIAANATRKYIEIATDCANTDSVAIVFGAGPAVYANHNILPPCSSWQAPAGVSVQTAIQVISNTGTQQVRVVEYP